MSSYYHRTSLHVGIFLFLVIISTAAEGQVFRNITGIRVDSYFDDTYGMTLENVFIAPVIEDRLQVHGEVRNETDNRSGTVRTLTGVHAGPIFLFTRHLYGLVVYGGSFRDSGNLVHELRGQLHYETARYRVDGGVRGFLEPEEDVAYLVASIGGRVGITERGGLFGKYFLGYNNDKEVSNSVWMEGDYRFTPRISARFGGTLGTGETDGTALDSSLQYSVISGVSMALSDRVTLRYQLEYFDQAGNPDGVRNLVLLDLRF